MSGIEMYEVELMRSTVDRAIVSDMSFVPKEYEHYDWIDEFILQKN